jgi:hypothetical protein
MNVWKFNLLAQADEVDQIIMCWLRDKIGQARVQERLISREDWRLLDEALSEAKSVERTHYTFFHIEATRMYIHYNLTFNVDETLKIAIVHEDYDHVKTLLRHMWKRAFISPPSENIASVISVVCGTKNDVITWLVYRYLRYRVFRTSREIIDRAFFTHANSTGYYFVVASCLHKPIRTEYRCTPLSQEFRKLGSDFFLIPNGTERVPCGRKYLRLTCELNFDKCQHASYSPITDGWSFYFSHFDNNYVRARITTGNLQQEIHVADGRIEMHWVGDKFELDSAVSVLIVKKREIEIHFKWAKQKIV